jgi:hypothetical protein
VTRVAADPRKDRVAVGYQDGVIRLVELAGAESEIRAVGGEPISALAFDGKRLAFGTEDGAAGLVEIAT